MVRFDDLRPDEPAGRVLFANPASSDARVNMTVRLSSDDGRTWPASRVLYLGPSAYSSLARLPYDTVGCLYERGDAGPYETLTFATFPVEWVENGP